MRWGGQEVGGDFRQVVVLPRPDGTVWSLTVQPLRLGFSQWLRERGVRLPNEPKVMARDSRGKPLRDADGLVLFQRDDSNDEYLIEVEKYHQRLAGLMVWEALKADETIEFETEPPANRDGWCEFADAILEELSRAGFAAGDLIWLCEQIAAVSNLAGEHLRDGSQHFFAGGQDRSS